MEKSHSGSSVGALPHCSIDSFTAPSVLKALKEMDRNHGRAVSDATEPTRNSAAGNEEEQREQEDVSRNRMFPSVPFSPMGSSSAEEPRSTDVAAAVSFNDAIPSPVYQGVDPAATATGSDAGQSLVDAMEIQLQTELKALSEADQQQVENDVRGRNPARLHSASSDHARSHDTQHLAAMELESLGRKFVNLLQTRPEFSDVVPAMDYDYVNDPQLRLKMLRAENYDTGAAALRLANFFKFVNEIFGPYLLMRPIQLVDLTPEERQLQRKGLQQLFKFRDHTGRRIMGCFDVHFPPNNVSFESQVCFPSAFGTRFPIQLIHSYLSM